MPKEVFISYSSLDRQWAEQVIKVLEINSISYWIAPDCIPGGSNYTTEIPLGIKNCVAFMILVTENTVRSPWVRKELDTAITENKLIIPLIVDGTVLPPDFSFLLNGVQHYSTASKADPTSAILDRLKKEIEALRENEPATDNPKKPKHTCPKCGCENINDDYRIVEVTVHEQIKQMMKDLWIYFMPFITSVIIFFMLMLMGQDPNKLILLCGAGMTFLQMLIKLDMVYRPVLEERRNLRRGVIVRRVSCCRCGCRFRLVLPADDYVFNQ